MLHVRPRLVVPVALAVSIAASSAHADAPPSRFRLALLLGIDTQTEYYEGVVTFSNGKTDFLSIDPDLGPVIALSLGYRFRDRITGYVGLGYAPTEATYIEKDNLRPDADFTTTRIDLGALYSVIPGPKIELGVGGGLTVAFHDVDRLQWDGGAVAPVTTGLGLHLLGAADFFVSPRVAVRAQLRFAVLAPGLDDLGEELARAEGEASARLDADAITEVGLAGGVVLGF